MKTYHNIPEDEHRVLDLIASDLSEDHPKDVLASLEKKGLIRKKDADRFGDVYEMPPEVLEDYAEWVEMEADRAS